jgi:predicted amidohydrolase
VTDEQAPVEENMAQRLVRAVAVGNRINLAAWRDDAHARVEIERIVRLATPFLAADRPNLIVLGEILGLPGALMGPRGAPARRMRTATRALTMLALADIRNVLALRRRFRGVTLPQALLLARTDALYRPLATLLPRLATRYNATIVAGTVAPLVTRSSHPRDIRRYGQSGAHEVYLPASREVYNTALIATPDGAPLQRVNKVFLTKNEQAILHLTPGKLSDVAVIATPAGRLGVAISLDAFTPAYLTHIDSLGAEIVVQPDANDQPWVSASATCDWQPQEWLNSVLGSVQPDYPHMQANVCAMQTGNFFEITFDGQSTITAKSDSPPDPVYNFVGNNGFIHTVTKRELLGNVLALAPWVVADPGTANPALTLEERRAALQAVGAKLLPGHERAGQFREVAIWADIALQ